MSYCATSDIEAVFGVTNVDNWADLDNDENATNIAARIARAIVVSDAEIDDIMRRTGYRTPLVDSSGNTPTTIVNLSATKSGLWLYNARGVTDFDGSGQPTHRLRYMQDWVQLMFNEIRDGNRELDAVH